MHKPKTPKRPGRPAHSPLPEMIMQHHKTQLSPREMWNQTYVLGGVTLKVQVLVQLLPSSKQYDCWEDQDTSWWQWSAKGKTVVKPKEIMTRRKPQKGPDICPVKCFKAHVAIVAHLPRAVARCQLLDLWSLFLHIHPQRIDTRDVNTVTQPLYTASWTLRGQKIG